MPRLPGPVLPTERLRLQVARPRDAAALARTLRDPAVHRTLGLGHPQSRAEALASIQRARRGQRRGHRLSYVVRDGSSGADVGLCAAKNVDAEIHRTGEVAYRLARTSWGPGLMAEAMAALCAPLFESVDLFRLHAQVFPRNRRSGRLLERLGFQWEGTLRKGPVRVSDGVRRDVRLYALLRTDAAARRLLRKA